MTQTIPTGGSLPTVGVRGRLHRQRLHRPGGGQQRRRPVHAVHRRGRRAEPEPVDHQRRGAQRRRRLSFGGVSGGLLSFYAASAGREAATSLAFNLDAGSGTEGAIESPSVSPVVGVSTGGLLAQVAGRGGAAGGPVAVVLGLGAGPGDDAADGVGGAGPVGRRDRRRWRRPGGGRSALDGGRGGAGLWRGQERGRSRRRRAGRRRPARPEGPPLQPEVKELPPWERLAVGLDRAWKQVRDEFLGKEGQAEAVKDRKPPVPERVEPGTAQPHGRPAPAAGTTHVPGPIPRTGRRTIRASFPLPQPRIGRGRGPRTSSTRSLTTSWRKPTPGCSLFAEPEILAATAVALASTLAADRVRRRRPFRVGAMHRSISLI